MKRRGQLGITLVALVVTIVVLLILAGVSINFVLGENGLITQAKEAREKALEAEKQEEKVIENSENYIKQNTMIKAADITAKDYGKVVSNYQDESTIWEIFYADENNIYLITRNGIETQKLSEKITSGYNGTNDFDASENFKIKYPAIQRGWLSKIYEPTENGKINYTSSYDNIKATEYLLDSSIWNKEYKNDKAEWAIGSPTLEMFVSSYNKVNNTNISELKTSQYGYNKNDILYSENSIGTSSEITENKQSVNIFNHGYNYWIASPSSYSDGCIQYLIYDKEAVRYASINVYIMNIRPVVCLKSDVTLAKNGDGESYVIK